MYVSVHNILEKSGAKGINDAKTPLYKYQTSINENFFSRTMAATSLLIRMSICKIAQNIGD